MCMCVCVHVCVCVCVCLCMCVCVCVCFESPRERIQCGLGYVRSLCTLLGISRRIWLDLRCDPSNCAVMQMARA